jgi:hypothetical protein
MNRNHLKYFPIYLALLFLLAACGPDPMLPATKVEATFFLLPDSVPVSETNIRCFSSRKEIRKTKTDKDGKLRWNQLHVDSISDLAWCMEDLFLAGASTCVLEWGLPSCLSFGVLLFSTFVQWIFLWVQNGIKYFSGGHLSNRTIATTAN